MFCDIEIITDGLLEKDEKISTLKCVFCRLLMYDFE